MINPKIDTKKTIEKLTISGFKSIRSLQKFPLESLNILIGPNGAGKSNFVSYFQMLHELVAQRLQVWTKKQGGADRILTFGVKETQKLESFVEFGLNGYEFSLEPVSEGGFIFTNETTYFKGPYYGPELLGRGQEEAKLKDFLEKGRGGSVYDYCYSSISNWRVFHFHDTSATAAVKRLGSLHDNTYLRSDASNLAAFLHKLKNEHIDDYNQIRKTVKLAIPFFDDFVFHPQELPSGEQQVQLLWRQTDSDYPFLPSQLSDGSIRFICLTTALLQPDPPSTLIIDEPELGLHPYALTLLGALMRSASKRMQIIVSTQSVPLINEFSIDDLIIVDRENDASIFKRPDPVDFRSWLEDYSIGELWEKNLLGGRPI